MQQELKAFHFTPFTLGLGKKSEHGSINANLDFGLDVLNRVAGLDLEGDSLASQCLDENLHPPTESEDEVEG